MRHPTPQGSHDDDPYRVLGVNTSASQQDIARAYRRGATHAHPDTQPTDPQATARFQALTAAYDLLSDPARRADYDRAHPAAEPTSQPPRGSHTRQTPRSPGLGLPYLLSPGHGQPLWAGPVHIEPPTGAGQQERSGLPAAEFEDPPIILGGRTGRSWSWRW